MFAGGVLAGEKRPDHAVEIIAIRCDFSMPKRRVVYESEHPRYRRTCNIVGVAVDFDPLDFIDFKGDLG